MVMQINVSQQLKESIGSTRNYEVSEAVDITGNGSDSQVQGKVKLTRTGRSILVKGRLQTEIELACSRCLSLFSHPLTLDIEDEYFPATDVVNGAPLTLPDEPSCFTIDEHHILDTTEAIRQYALLAIPMKPLCHQDCAGLCPSYGHNLNEGTCGCPPQEIDPRWTELSKLAMASSVNKQKGTE